jgi:glutamate-ammonia-ligase adenylyltransferase
LRKTWMQITAPLPLDRLEQLLRSWCERHPAHHVRLEAVLPAVVAEAARAAEPEPTLQSALDLLERMAQWPRYLTSLSQHPGAVRRLVGLIGASPWLAQLLTARPALADELLPDRYAARPLDRAALQGSLQGTLKRCSDDEMTIWIALRNFKHSCLLHILALDLEGALDLDEVSGALSDLADVLLETVLARVSARQGVAGLGGAAPIGIVAYGKLGSREMSYASDTDIVFLHEDAPAAGVEALSRLASTVNQWVTAPTAAGILYETDFRLRPYGASGLLVTSVAAFRDYQLNAAWTWEHQALTRARFIAGAPALAAAFAQLRRDVIGRVREPEKLRRDVLEMRKKIEASHSRSARPQDDLFDVKHSRGGVIDLEFIVQYLILQGGQAHPALLEVHDNATALESASTLGLIPVSLARAATTAYATYRLWMHRERLRGNETVRAPRAELQVHEAAVRELWAHVFAETFDRKGTTHA